MARVDGRHPREVEMHAFDRGVAAGHHVVLRIVGVKAWPDCGVIVAGDDLRITVYTAEPGTQDAERLALAIVLGTQDLID